MDPKEQAALLEKTITDVFTKGMGDVKEELQKSMSDLVNEKFAKFLEEQKIDLKNLVPKNGEPGSDEGQKYAKIGSFIKSVLKNDVASLVKGMSEGQDSAGGFLVPEEFHNEVIRIAKDYGLVAAQAQTFTMNSDVLNVPTEASSVTTYWTGEAANATASQPVISNARLEAKDLVGLTVTTNQLLADAGVDTLQYLMGIFAEAMAGEVDNQAFNGTGSPFTGIFNDAGVTVVTMGSGQTTFASTKLGDLRDLISQVQTSVLPTSAFYMHRLTWGAIQKIQEGSQTVAAIQYQPINMGVGQKDAKMQQPAGYLWGYPVYLSDTIVSTTAISTKFVAFGSMKKGLFYGDRQSTAMDISKDATISGVNLFQSNQSAVRLIQRLAVKLGLPAAFAVLKTAAS